MPLAAKYTPRDSAKRSSCSNKGPWQQIFPNITTHKSIRSRSDDDKYLFRDSCNTSPLITPAESRTVQPIHASTVNLHKSF